jgi:hypothetical protein
MRHFRSNEAGLKARLLEQLNAVDLLCAMFEGTVDLRTRVAESLLDEKLQVRRASRRCRLCMLALPTHPDDSPAGLIGVPRALTRSVCVCLARLRRTARSTFKAVWRHASRCAQDPACP